MTAIVHFSRKQKGPNTNVCFTAQNLRSVTTVTASAKSDTKNLMQYISYRVMFGVVSVAVAIPFIVFMMLRRGVGVLGGDGPTGDSSAPLHFIQSWKQSVIFSMKFSWFTQLEIVYGTF